MLRTVGETKQRSGNRDQDRDRRGNGFEFTPRPVIYFL